jgi:hypothetical protein
MPSYFLSCALFDPCASLLELVISSPCLLRTLQLGSVTFKNVLHVPGIDRNLISVGESPHTWDFLKHSTTIRSTNGTALLTAQKINGLYVLKASTIYALSAQTSADLLQDWHHRLGHLNVRDVMRLERAGRLGDSLGHVSASDVLGFVCKSCIIGKGKRLPSPPH